MSWGSGQAENHNGCEPHECRIIATGVAPANDAESAIVITLNRNPYTAIVQSADGAPGIALVEAYNINP